MSIALALLAATQTVSPAAAEEEEIVVIGRRFEQAAVVVGKDAKGSFTCSLTATSGNAKLDERLCRTAAKCVIKGASDNAAVKTCIDRKKPGLFAQFRKEWKQGAKR